MAIIGNINQIQKRLFKTELLPVFSYLISSLKSSSMIAKRIKEYKVGAFERVELESGIFALEQVFMTKSRESCFFESHLKYIDFQLLLEGEEQMEVLHQNNATISSPYQTSKDLILYEHSNESSKILMKPGDLAIYFPEDIHMGLGWKKEANLVRKTVIKLPIEKWSTK